MSKRCHIPSTFDLRCRYRGFVYEQGINDDDAEKEKEDKVKEISTANKKFAHSVL